MVQTTIKYPDLTTNANKPTKTNLQSFLKLECLAVFEKSMKLLASGTPLWEQIPQTLGPLLRMHCWMPFQMLAGAKMVLSAKLILRTMRAQSEALPQMEEIIVAGQMLVHL